MRKKIYLLWACMSICAFSLSAQTGCPGCIVSLPPLSADTIYISSPIDGEVNQVYQDDLSFRLPKTTTPVAGNGVPPGLTISQFVITSVSNLPPGLRWQPNQTTFNPANQTDGCVRICGTPLVSDTFFIEVTLDATVIVITQSTTVIVPIYIAPATSSNAGFSISNAVGCGTVTASFQNNVPSLGAAGFSYLWNFGNGNTSTLEQPGSQTYAQPGTYPVSFSARVDTVGFILNEIKITNVGCSDPFNGPDLFIEIDDSNGTRVFNSSTFDNASLPLTIPVGIKLQTGNYQLRVRDDDGIVGNANCGTTNFNRASNGVLTNGDLTVQLSIVNPIQTINSQDTVFVWTIPALPMATSSVPTPYCTGDKTTITANYSNNLQWFKDSVLINGQTTGTYETAQAGTYYMTYTSPEGCSSTSAAFQVTAPNALPPNPVFIFQMNQLYYPDTASLNSNIAIDWYIDGSPLNHPYGNLCADITGEYTLELTNTVTGCSNAITSLVTINPNINCTTSTDEALAAEFKLYPNPASANVQWEISEAYLGGQWTIIDAMGRTINQGMLLQSKDQTPVGQLPTGMYWVRMQDAYGTLPVITQRLIVQR